MDEKNIQERFRAAQQRLVIQSSDLSLRTLSDMVEKAAIDLEPAFQRRHRWHSAKQSQLIESFILNIPIPPVYLAEEDYGKYVVVDGKQRLAAIHRFMTNDLKLEGLESFHELEGRRFDALPADIANALEVRPYLRVVTLLRQTDPELKYEVFVRLNRGGESMEPQEVRKVAFRGPLTDLIYDLSANEFLRSQLKIKDADSSAFAKMQDAEFVLRFLALRERWEVFSGALQMELDEFNRHHRTPSPQDLANFQQRFTRAIDACRDIWGPHAFQRIENGAWRNQLLAGMYDAQMIAVDQLTDAQLESAVAARAEVIERMKQLCAEPEFDKAVRVGTNTPDRVRYRILKVKELLVDV